MTGCPAILNIFFILQTDTDRGLADLQVEASELPVSCDDSGKVNNNEMLEIW